MISEDSNNEFDNPIARRAIETLGISGNCAQTTFAVLQAAYGLDGQEILKALTPFPGLALRGETCGAVTGCLMAIGLVYGRDELDDWQGFITSLRPARRFCRQFESLHGSTMCANLLETKLGRSFNLANQVETLAYLSAGGQQKCGELIVGAVEIASELIEKQI